MISVPALSAIASIHDAKIIMKSGDVSAYKAGDTIRLTYAPDVLPRYGSVGITKVDYGAGVIYTDAPVKSAIVAACESDHVCIETSDTFTDDHAALVAYLLSAVRRRDWHAVSDAACDLRVLEASRR